MRGFYGVASLVQLIALEYVAGFCLGLLVWQSLILGTSWFGCQPDASFLSIPKIVGGLIAGGLAATWLVRGILFPGTVGQAYRPMLNVEWLQFKNPVIASASYLFTTTHPSYVLVELLFIFPWLDSVTSSISCDATYLVSRCMGRVMIAFPLLRLVSWFVLRRKPRDYQNAWKSVMWFFVIVSPILLLYVAAVGVDAIRSR